MKLTQKQKKFIDENMLEQSPTAIAKKLKIEPEVVLNYIKGDLPEKEIEKPAPSEKKDNITDKLMGKRRGATIMTGGMSGYLDDTRKKGDKIKDLGYIHKPKG